MTTAGQVFIQVRTLVDDDDQDFTTPDYLAPKVQMAQDKLVLNVLANPNMGALKVEVVLPSVPQGTKSLKNYFDPADPSGGPLALLTDIISLRERPASGSQNEQDWVAMDMVPDLPATQPTSFNRVFVWNLDDIRLLGCDQATDIRVFGKFTPKFITDEKSLVVPNTGVILAYDAASIIAYARGNPALGAVYSGQARALTDSLFANAIMAQQAMRIRMKPFRTFLFPFR